MPTVQIRYATTDDAELIAEMSRQTFYETFAAANTKENMDKFMNSTFTKAALLREVGEKGNIFLLAYRENEPVGYARLRESIGPPALSGSPSIEIARIYATAGSIGSGVGKALMQQCITVASAGKKEWIWLGVWEHNERAIDFYRRWGFEKFGTHTFLLGDDPQTDWLMKKQIQTA